MAIEAGAKEIDIVINRKLALNQQWTELYEEASNEEEEKYISTYNRASRPPFLKNVTLLKKNKKNL